MNSFGISRATRAAVLSGNKDRPSPVRGKVFSQLQPQNEVVIISCCFISGKEMNSE